MAITRASLASSSAAGAGPYTTVSQTPTANAYIDCCLIFQIFGGGTLPTGCTVNGNGDSSWAPVANQIFVAGAMSCWKFRTMIASPSAGTVTITPSGDASLKLCHWHFEEYPGVDTTGTQGSGALVQFVAISSPSANPQVGTYTLAALGDATNNATASFAASGSLCTPSDTELIDRSASDYFMHYQWALPGNTSMTATAATAFQPQGGYALELKAASGAANFNSTGDLDAQSATIAGAATVSRTATGGLQAQAAQIAGDVTVNRVATGDLQVQGATISGEATTSAVSGEAVSGVGKIIILKKEAWRFIFARQRRRRLIKASFDRSLR